MGVYLRKSFRAGPVRFNLSKSGIGTSVGVKGLRIGASPSGRAYVHAGRGGLYHRASLSSSPRLTESTSLELEPETVAIDTGVTYGQRQDSKQTVEAELKRRSAPTYWYVLVLGGILFCADPLIASVAVLSWLVLFAVAKAKFRRGDAYGMALQQAVRRDEESREPILTNSRIRPEDRQYFGKLTYAQLVLEIVTDGRVSEPELRNLKVAETLCRQDADFYHRAKLEAYRKCHLEAVSDHDLTPAEEATLEHLRAALGISTDELSEEMALVEELRGVRAVRTGPLPEVQPETALQASETCHFEAEGRLLKSRVIKTYQREGQRHRVVGLAVDKEGRLLITSKRVMLVHSGVTSVPLTKILDVEIDGDQRVITIVKDGASKPILVTTPQAIRAGAILSVLVGV